jgi:hypothetical protein
VAQFEFDLLAFLDRPAWADWFIREVCSWQQSGLNGSLWEAEGGRCTANQADYWLSVPQRHEGDPVLR